MTKTVIADVVIEDNQFALAYIAKHSKLAFGASSLQEGTSNNSFTEILTVRIDGYKHVAYIVGEYDNGIDCTIVVAYAANDYPGRMYRLFIVDHTFGSSEFAPRQSISLGAYSAEDLEEQRRIIIDFIAAS